MGSGADWWRPAQVVDDVKTARNSGGSARGTFGYQLTYWALIGFSVILLLAPQEQFPVLAPLRIALVSVVVAVFACGFNRLSRRMPLLEFSPDVLLLLLLIGWAVLTIPFSFWPGGSAAFLTGTYLKAIICFLLLSHAITDFRQLRGICWCLVLCTVPLTLYTLANYVTGTHMGDAERVLGYSSGLAENPNDMALLLNLILPLCIALMLGSKSSFKTLMLAAIAVLIVVAVIATFSRAGFLTLLIIGASYAWLMRNRPQRIWIPIILVMGVFALPLVPSSYFERLDTIINVEADETNSAQTRLTDMRVAAGLALDNPVMGTGIGMSVLAMDEAREGQSLEVHNVYLQLALDMGFIGLLLFLLLLFQCLRVTGGVIDGRDDQPNSRQLVFIAEALRVSLLAFALSAMFYPVAYNFYFYYFAGLAIAAGRVARIEAEGGRQ